VPTWKKVYKPVWEKVWVEDHHDHHESSGGYDSHHDSFSSDDGYGYHKK
jgi:hypothetical protein